MGSHSDELTSEQECFKPNWEEEMYNELTALYIFLLSLLLEPGLAWEGVLRTLRMDV